MVRLPLLAAEPPLVSAFDVLAVLAAGALLLALILGARRLAPLVPMLSARRERLAGLGPVLELIAWVVFVAGAVAHLTGEHAALRVLGYAAVGAALAAAFWFVVRDYLAGVVLRAERRYRPGDTVTTDQLTGRVRAVGLRALELELDGGSVVALPYGKLRATSLVRGERSGAAVPHRFILERPAGVEFGAFRRAVRHAALLSHWSAPRYDPVLRELDGLRVEVTVRCLSADRVRDLEREVREALASLPPEAPPPATEPARRKVASLI